MKFTLLLQQRPISLNTRSKAKYQATLAQKATREMNNREMMQGRLRARIIWFHAEPTTQDADNIVKPILDALKSIVYKDDLQIGECYVSRIDINQLYDITGEPSLEILRQISNLTTAGDKNLVLIEILEAEKQIIDFEVEQEK